MRTLEDRNGGAGRLDGVAGCEFIDDRIRQDLNAAEAEAGDQSARSAVTGLTSVARKAGTKLATTVAAASVPQTET